MKILFYGPGLPDFALDEVYERPLGGTEHSICQLVRVLRKLRHKVEVCGWEAKFSDWKSYCKNLDIMIHVNVADEDEFFEVNCKHIFWSHFPEIVWTQERVKTEKKALERMNGFVFLSYFHWAEWKRIAFEDLDLGFDGMNEMTKIIGYGIEDKFFQKKWERQNRRKSLVYCSLPNRGLNVLLDWAPEILALDDEVEIEVYSDWGIYHGEGCGLRELESHDSWNLDRVWWMRGLPFPQLAEALGGAYAMCYPCTKFNETFCLAAFLAQAAGLPVVSTAAGALLETARGQLLVAPVGGAIKEVYEEDGSLVQDIYKRQFLENLEWLLHSKQVWEFYHQRALDNVRGRTWEVVGKEWIGFLEAI